jgi:hypothetical protein
MTITYVIPCGGAKLDRPARARDLYTGSMFRHTLTAALALADGDDARVLILSAQYGLLDLDEFIAPYDQRMDQPGRVTTDVLTLQALLKGIGSEVYGLLPRAYFDALDAALRPLCIWMQDTYEATGGIGEQRRVNAICTTA